VAGEERLEHVAALLGEAQALAARGILGMAERIGGAAPVIVVGVPEHGTDGGHRNVPRARPPAAKGGGFRA
jgi:hypothetical protein